MSIREKAHRLDHELYIGLLSISFTLCIENKKPAFQDEKTVQAFIEILSEVVQKAGCLVPVYCFMPDHLHLLLTGGSEHSNLWKTTVHFKQRTGFWLSRNRPEIKWQKDFYDHIIRSDEKIAVQVRYILDNPVRKGLAQTWQAYPFKGSVGCDMDQTLNAII